MLPFKCTSCGRTQDFTFGGGACPTCGGMLDLAAPLPFDPAQCTSTQGIWRYAHTFPLPPNADPVTLGEGQTPLVTQTIEGRAVHFKLEMLNPTGSYKDRGMSVMFTALKAVGIAEAVEDSSGNAGAAFAGYAARAGVRGRVFVPASAAGPKRQQIAAYGAEIVAIEGPRSKAAEAAQNAVKQGAFYGSHIYHPLNMAGYATAAYEIWEQLGHAPETVLLPVGHGGFLIGLYRGFQALKNAGCIDRLPRLVGVQAMACAPLWAAYRYGREGLGWVTEGATVAEGIRVVFPVRGDMVLHAVQTTSGTLLAVEDPDILTGRDALARLGLYVEPTSGAVWPALAQIPGEVVVLLTGHGLKFAG